MIRGVFSLGGENQEVIIKGNELLFFDIASGTMTSIEGLKLSKSGVIKEMPQLKEDKEWRKKAIQRLKKEIKKHKVEKNKMNYVKEELIKFGYQPLYMQRAGFRPENFK